MSKQGILTTPPPPPPFFIIGLYYAKQQREIRASFYFIRITQYTDKMISVLQDNVSAMWQRDATKPQPAQQGSKKGSILVHDLGSDNNQFLRVVVESVHESVKQTVEEYC